MNCPRHGPQTPCTGTQTGTNTLSERFTCDPSVPHCQVCGRLLQEAQPTQPVITWVEEETPLGTLIKATHEGPCVFIDSQCSCGLLDLGVVKGHS